MLYSAGGHTEALIPQNNLLGSSFYARTPSERQTLGFLMCGLCTLEVPARGQRAVLFVPPKDKGVDWGDDFETSFRCRCRLTRWGARVFRRVCEGSGYARAHHAKTGRDRAKGAREHHSREGCRGERSGRRPRR